MAKNKQFLIIGVGRFGQALAKTLHENGAEVLAVDSDSQCVKAVAPFASEAICVDATNEKALEKFGIDQFDAVVVCTSSVDASIFITLTCKQMGAKKLIAKAKSQRHKEILEKIGADILVFPEEESAQKLGDALASPNMLAVMDVSDSFEIVSIRTPAKWNGKTKESVCSRFEVHILLVKRDNAVLSHIEEDFVFALGDFIVIGGEERELERIRSLATESVAEGF